MGRDNRRLRAILVLLVLTSLTFLALDSRGGSSFSGLRSAASSVFGPLQRLGGSVGGSVGDSVSGAVHSGRDRQALKAAEQKNAELQAQIDDLTQARADEDALKSLGFFAGRGSYDIKPARLIGTGEPVGAFAQTVTLDIGASSGITKDMAVVTGDGLVGRVVQVGSGTCVVGLLTDPDVSVGVRLVDGGTSSVGAYVTGAGAGKPLTLTYPVANVQLTAGAALESVEKTFPPGLPVGTISKPVNNPGGLSQSAEITPYVNLRGLDVVGVIVSYDQGVTRQVVPRTLVSPTPAGSAPPAAP